MRSPRQRESGDRQQADRSWHAADQTAAPRPAAGAELLQHRSVGNLGTARAAAPRLIQRQCRECQEEEEGGGAGDGSGVVQRRCRECEEEAVALGRIQPKLEVGSADDPLEREADQTAQRVLRGVAGEVSGVAPSGARRSPAVAGGAGRVAAEGGATALSADRLAEQVAGAAAFGTHGEADQRPDRVVQGSGARSAAAAASPGFEARLGALGSGAALSPGVRAFFEPRFGYDLGTVRVHSGAQAAETARMIGARAFAIGPQIVFGTGQYAPGSRPGARLLAHELTHVIQQGGARAIPGGDPARIATSSPRGRVARDGVDAEVVLPGDRLTLTVTLGGPRIVEDAALPVDDQGSVYVDFVDVRVPIAGLSLHQARALLVGELSRRARVPLGVALTAQTLGGIERQPPVTATAAASGPVSDFILPGRRLVVAVRMVDGTPIQGATALPVDDQGNLAFFPFDATVQVRGLTIREAEERMAGELSRLARVPLIVELSAQTDAPPSGERVAAGDRLRISVAMVEGHALSTDEALPVDEGGSVLYRNFDASVHLAGLTLAGAEARLAEELSRRAGVPLQVTLEADTLGGREVEHSPPGRSEADRADRLWLFNDYISREDDVEVALRYGRLFRDIRDTEELFTIEPWQLYGRALERPPPDPRLERLELYFRFVEAQNEGNRAMEGQEALRNSEAMSSFIDWFDANRETDALMERHPIEVYGELRTTLLIRDIHRESERRVLEQRREREFSPEMRRRRGEKYDEFLSYAQRLWGFSSRNYPYSIPIPSEGRDILVTGDPARQAVLDALAGDLMSWATSHLHDPSFLSAATTPERVVLDLLRGGYDQRLAAASLEPLESESIDRNEILPGRALGAAAETVGGGLLLIGAVGLFVGAEIITAGQATWLLVGLAGAGGVSSYLDRREEIERGGYDVPIPETMVHAAGDVVAVSQLLEGWSGQELGTERRLSSVERSDQAGTGAGGVALVLTGSRAYRQGQSVGQRWRVSRRGLTPAGPEGNIQDPLPADVVPPEPVRHPTPGPVEARVRAALPEEARIGFDIWMELVRGGDRPGNPEVFLDRMPEPQIRAVAERSAAVYQARVQSGRQAASIRERALSDPLRPRVRHVEPADNILLRYENEPPSAAEIRQGQDIARQTGEPVQLFGDTPARRSYPGIDGTIGVRPRPLSLKESLTAQNSGWVRVHATDALAKAAEHSYTNVEVHIHMRGSTLEQIRSGWANPSHTRGSRAVFDDAGTVARIVIHGTDGRIVLDPSLTGPGLPALPVPQGREQGETEEERP